jgi:Amt family ammonium transporter
VGHDAGADQVRRLRHLAVVFAGFIYPIASHWVFGGGWLQVNVGMQDFAGSTAVHMIGATGGLAALLLLGPRRGKYGSDGRPAPSPGTPCRSSGSA